MRPVFSEFVSSKQISSILVLIRTVITTLKRLLIGLVVALVVGSASWAWADTINWTFGTAGNYTVSDATKVEVAGGVAKLIAVDQTDDDNTSTGFGGGTHNGTQWDAINSWLEVDGTTNLWELPDIAIVTRGVCLTECLKKRKWEAFRHHRCT